jgi:hypothetical protein
MLKPYLMPAQEQLLELQENEMLIVFATLVFMSTMMEKELGGSRDADVTQQLSKLGSLIDKVFKFVSPDCDIPSMN